MRNMLLLCLLSVSVIACQTDSSRRGAFPPKIEPDVPSAYAGGEVKEWARLYRDGKMDALREAVRTHGGAHPLGAALSEWTEPPTESPATAWQLFRARRWSDLAARVPEPDTGLALWPLYYAAYGALEQFDARRALGFGESMLERFPDHFVTAEILIRCASDETVREQVEELVFEGAQKDTPLARMVSRVLRWRPADPYEEAFAVAEWMNEEGEDPFAVLWLADRWIQTGHIDTARVQLEEALARYPFPMLGDRLRGKLLEVLARLDEAAAVETVAADIINDEERIRAVHAAWSKAGHQGRALRATQRAAKGGSAAGAALLAFSLSASRNYAAAYAWAVTAVTRGATPDRRAMAFAWGRLAGRAGGELPDGLLDAQLTHVTYEWLLAASPGLGRQTLDRIAERAMESYPGSPSLLRRLSQTYESLGDRAKAVTLLEKSVGHAAPGSFEDYVGDIRLGGSDAAPLHHQRLRERYVWSPSVWDGFHIERGDEERAWNEALREAAERNPGRFWPHGIYVRALLRLKDFERIGKHLDRIADDLEEAPFGDRLAMQEARIETLVADLRDGSIEAGQADETLRQIGAYEAMGGRPGFARKFRYFALVAKADRDAAREALAHALERNPDDGDLIWDAATQGGIGGRSGLSIASRYLDRAPTSVYRLRMLIQLHVMYGGSPAVALLLTERLRGIEPNSVNLSHQGEAFGQLGNHRLAYTAQYRRVPGIGNSLRYIAWFDSARQKSQTESAEVKVDAARGRVIIRHANGREEIRVDHPVSGRPVEVRVGEAWVRAWYDDEGEYLRGVTTSADFRATLVYEGSRLATIETNRYGTLLFHPLATGEGMELEYQGRRFPLAEFLRENGGADPDIRQVRVILRETFGFEPGSVPELFEDPPSVARLRLAYAEAMSAAAVKGSELEALRAGLALARELQAHLGARLSAAEEAWEVLRFVGRTAAGREGDAWREMQREVLLSAHELLSRTRPDGVTLEDWDTWSLLLDAVERQAAAGNAAAERALKTVEAEPLQTLAGASLFAESAFGDPGLWSPAPHGASLKGPARVVVSDSGIVKASTGEQLLQMDASGAVKREAQAGRAGVYRGTRGAELLLAGRPRPGSLPRDAVAAAQVGETLLLAMPSGLVEQSGRSKGRFILPGRVDDVAVAGGETFVLRRGVPERLMTLKGRTVAVPLRGIPPGLPVNGLTSIPLDGRRAALGLLTPRGVYLYAAHRTEPLHVVRDGQAQPVFGAVASVGHAVLMTATDFWRADPSLQSLTDGPVLDMLSAAGGQKLYLARADRIDVLNTDGQLEPRMVAAKTTRRLREGAAGEVLFAEHAVLYAIHPEADAVEQRVDLKEAGISDPIIDFLTAPDGAVWMTAPPWVVRWHEGRLQKFSWATDPEQFPARSDLPATLHLTHAGKVRVVCSDENHRILNGAPLVGGVLEWNGERFERLSLSDETKIWFATAYTPMEPGVAVVGTLKGFVRHEGDAWRPYAEFDRTYQAIYRTTPALYMGTRGARLGTDDWVFGSAAGLLRLQRGEWKLLADLNDRLPGVTRWGPGAGVVHAVAADRAGHLYVGTDRGLLRVAAERLNAAGVSATQAADAPSPPRTQTAGKAERPAWGAEKPALEVVVYHDYQGSMSARLHMEVITRLAERFPQLRFSFYDRPQTGHSSLLTAVAVRCAHAQDKLAAYQGLVLSNLGRGSAEELRTFAKLLGLDLVKFAACQEDPEQMKAVFADVAEGDRRRVKALPYMQIGDKTIVGLMPMSHYEEAVQAALGGAAPAQSKAEPAPAAQESSPSSQASVVQASVAPGSNEPVAMEKPILLGPADAAETLEVWLDYAQPFASRFLRELAPEVLRKAEGRLRIAVYPAPMLDAGHDAALAVHCAHDGGKLDRYLRTLFSERDRWGNKGFQDLAGEAGLDTGAFQACFGRMAEAWPPARSRQYVKAAGSPVPGFRRGQTRGRAREGELRNAIRDILGEPGRTSLPYQGRSNAKVEVLAFQAYSADEKTFFKTALAELPQKHPEAGLLVVGMPMSWNETTPYMLRAQLCAAEKRRLQDFHALLFDARVEGFDDLFAVAEKAKLSRKDFRQCLFSDKHAEAMDAIMDTAQRHSAFPGRLPVVLVDGNPVLEPTAEAVGRAVKAAIRKQRK